MKHYRWAIFGITACLFLLSQFYRASNAVIAPHLVQDLDLDTKGLGLLSGVFFYSFALTQIPLGMVLDRIGARWSMTVLSLLGVVGTLIFAWSDSLQNGLIGRALIGVGMACNLMGTFKLLTVWFDPKIFATLSGIIMAIGTAGNMAATSPLVVLVQRVGWRSSFSLIAGVNLILALVLFVVVRDRPAGDKPPLWQPSSARGDHRLTGQLKTLLFNRNFWIISSGSFFRYGVFGAIQTLWAGPYLIDVMGLSPFSAGNLILLMNIGLVIGGPCWGMLSDRRVMSQRYVVAVGLALFALVLFIKGLMPPGAGMIRLGVLFFASGFLAGNSGLFYAHIKELMPLHMAGMAMTGINFFTMLGAGLFTHGLGILMQTLYAQASTNPDAFRSAFWLCAACLGAVAVVYTFARDADPQRHTVEE